ncbi:MAG: N-acetylmuramoyl-L-alanine amidase [Meiothermus sp.]|uniref:N-acetylmuramoyl-L-alanine amidase family protein n=1 Tax=Meiothermus sp. TaxID=1955249 RepID=UPI0025FBDFB6|nr:N-acetylmuramoyl-L-alanine amidase [Meiothermus sp.]MCS7195203.1 N-acetylmuramoyl-L-alanine amidase [Meiothermus sp.]MCX7741636.1 N-acetylmuramoyl-L-alanine amidase [Meiothermus sp.]MDW8091139.1 N-acetylmuramoyl-L-alanine amidase [Meiothermus sp.]MDW8482382.1 N-acetylmuramoyl-L-alanine amidase [Meiothermus sp.]
MRLLALLVVCFPLAMAFPRLGLHEGYTRLVFDLEKGVQYQIAQTSDTLTLRFTGNRPPASDNDVGSPQVASYQVVPTPQGANVFVRLRPGVEVKTFLLEDANRRRLVVDVLTANQAPTSPPAAQPRPNPPKPRAQPKVVVLDPGHGGVDPGAVGFVVEKEVTLDLALRVKRILEREGVEVVLTRNRDTHLSPDKATDLGLRAEMANSKRNLFVSIHVNSASTPAQGIEVYYFGNTLDPALLAQVIRENGGGEVGRRLTQEAQSVSQRIMSDLIAQSNLMFSRQLAHYVQASLLRATGAVDRGVRQAPFYVLRNARIPAILVEVGFANHPTEGRKLQTDAYRQALAEGLARGILRFLNNGE